MVGMSVYEMTELIPIENRTGVTMLEGLGAALLFYPLYRIPALDILFSYHIVSNLFCMIILFSYAYGTGLFTAWIFRKNEFVEYLAKHVLDVFLFHFTIFHYASLSPKLSSPYLLLAEGIVLSCFIGVLIDRILEIRAGQKRTA